jgi:putative polyhydroxyalkanoate system protein
MPAIVVRRQHDLGLAKAKSLAQTIARQLKDDYGGSFMWKGDILHFERIGASGSVAVTKDDFRVTVELGFLLSPLRSQFEREILTFCDAHFVNGDGSGRSQPVRRTGRRGRGTRSS